MIAFRAITQTINDVDKTEPLFYGIAIFSFVTLLIILYCIFCCLQHNQLDDYSFVENLNQQLINNGQSLLNFPKSTKHQSPIVERIANKEYFKQLKASYKAYETSSLNKSSFNTLKTTYIAPFNLNNNLNNFSPNQTNQINNLSTSTEIITKQNYVKDISNVNQPKHEQSNQFQANILSMLSKKIKNETPAQQPKIVLDQNVKRKVDPKLVAEFRLKMLNKLKAKSNKEIIESKLENEKKD